MTATAWRENFVKELKETRTTYREMIDFCCENMILNNDIIAKYNEHYYDVEVYSGLDFDEETEEFVEIFQYYIISGNDAERLADYTNEIVYYLPEFDMYLLGATHWGTAWDGVSANWK